MTGNMTSDTETPHHVRTPAPKKVVLDTRTDRSRDRRGLLIINTGNGKGKSSAAFGMIARALGHNRRVGIVQFARPGRETGEEIFFRQYPQVEYRVVGEESDWEFRHDGHKHLAVNIAWNHALRMLSDPVLHLVLLDELNVALNQHQLEISHVTNALQARPAHQHVIITGRNARPELLALADTVTDIHEVKHAFNPYDDPDL